VLDDEGIAYEVAPGDGAFYAPKVSLAVEDRLGRRWQLGTVQLDRQLPRRFELAYVTPGDRRVAPVVLHRAIFGSFERMVGILLGHHDGRFPLWLAPVGAVVLPRGEADRAEADAVAAAVRREGVRVEVDAREETLGRRVRDAEAARVPVLLVVGERERRDGTVALRRGGVRAVETLPRAAAVTALGREARERLSR
jgi:threonyl-tRNA synthetase